MYGLARGHAADGAMPCTWATPAVNPATALAPSSLTPSAQPWPPAAATFSAAGSSGAEAARVAAFFEAATRLAAAGVCIAPDAQLLATEVTARLQLATQQLAAGNLAAAEYSAKAALWLRPDCVEAFVACAGVFLRRGDAAGARALYAHAARLQPRSAAVLCCLAAAAAASGTRAEDVALYFAEATRVDPSCADAHVGLGSCAKDAGRLEEAEAHFAAAVRLRPRDARLHAFLAGVLYERGRLLEAVQTYTVALSLEPGFADALNDLGNSLRGLGRLDDAHRCYAACLSRHASTGNASPAAVAIGYSNLGAVLKLQGRGSEAVACFRIACHLLPENADAHAALGGALKDVGQHELALACLRTSLALKPQHATRAQLVHALASVCHWDGFPDALAQLTDEVRELLARGQPCAVQPFHAMGYDLDPSLVLELTRAHAAQVLAAARLLGVPPFVHPAPAALLPGKRLRVGFVSSDFGQHPLSMLMGSVFGLMDRTRFEVFLYALSAPDGSHYRERIEAEAEHFLDATEMSVPLLAQRVYVDGIQVLVDLNGYTKGSRTEVFALRPAPLQVAYMGFPATSGATFIDWLVIDRVVAPPALAQYYSERLCRLPHSYFVNDYAQQQVLDERQRPSRAQVGLPEHAFVFMCANQLYKIDPETFDTWCSILRRVPHAVLWLLRFPPFGEARLRAEAARRGVAPVRLVFSDVAPKQAHLLRCGLADLFLDTPLVNAHTTGCDVLWAGVPLLTLPGQRFASRVGASLVTALGCSDCVMASRQAYEERAVELATQPEALRQLTQRVRRNSHTHPLFDTRRWVRNFDAALLMMWQLHARGDVCTRALDVPDVTARQGGAGA